MLNQCTFIGRLTRDPDLKYTANQGIAVANFTLAVDRTFKNNQGEKEADFINIVTWRKQAENCAEYLSKGSMAAVAGRLQIRSYDDKEGIRRKVAEIVADNVRFLDGGKKKQTEEQEEGGTVEDMLNSGTEVDPDDVPF